MHSLRGQDKTFGLRLPESDAEARRIVRERGDNNMTADNISVDGIQVPEPVSPEALREADFKTTNPQYNDVPRNADRVGGERTFGLNPRTTEEVWFNGTVAAPDVASPWATKPTN